MPKGLILIAAALAAPASAPTAKFADFVERADAAVRPPAPAEMAVGALETMKAIAAHEKSCVPTAVRMEPPSSATAVRLATELIQAGKIRNAWTAYGRPVGCPSPAPTRFIVLRMADGTLMVRAVNRGESLANPSLMRDSSGAAAMAGRLAVRKVKPDCTDSAALEMDITRVVSKSADLAPDWHGARYAGSWKEGWTFRVCGRRVEVPISFTADGESGAHWTVHATEAKLLN